MRSGFEGEDRSGRGPYVVQRGTTPRIRIPVDVDLTRMEEVSVEFSNCGRAFSKSLSDGEAAVAASGGGCVVEATLTSADTLSLRPFCALQARVRYSRGGAANATWPVLYEVVD